MFDQREELPLLPFGNPIGPSTLLRMVNLPIESLMVRVPHHDPEHGGSIFLTTLSLPFESLRAVSLSNRSNHFVSASRGGVYIKLFGREFIWGDFQPFKRKFCCTTHSRIGIICI